MPHLQTRKIRRSCQRSVSKQIRKEVIANRRKPVSQRRSVSQVRAIGISKVRQKRTRCREVLRRLRRRAFHR